MAVNISRSMNAELAEGATDGTLRKRHPDRAGVVESTQDEAHDEAVAMGTGPSTSYPNYGDDRKDVALSGIRRR
jgi:hypothetical protein